MAIDFFLIKCIRACHVVHTICIAKIGVRLYKCRAHVGHLIILIMVAWPRRLPCVLVIFEEETATINLSHKISNERIRVRRATCFDLT